MMKLWRVVTFLLVASVVLGQKEIRTCRVLSGNYGLCVPIRRCNSLVVLIDNLQSPLPEDVGLLVRDSFFCGHDKGTVLICCPVQGLDTNVTDIQPSGEPEENVGCQLQDGKEAVCVTYSECHPFKQMLGNLKQPFPAAVPFLMKEVFLCGQDFSTGLPIPKICCPSEAMATVQDEEVELEEELITTTTQPLPWYKAHPNIARLSNLDTCGRSFIYERIVGGKNASLGQYPWLVNIGYTVSDKIEYKCGGSLIGPQHVLTAAHCVSGLPSSYTFSNVRIGEFNLLTDPDCEDPVTEEFCSDPPQEFSPLSVIVHPEYNKPSRFRNDIALVKLDRPVVENDFVAPICLPFSEFVGHPYPKDVDPEVAGWGAIDVFARRFADILQYVHVPFAESEVCSKRYRAMRVKLGDSQLCAGGRKGEDSCGGDSGSALMLEAFGERDFDPRVVQVGVVSFGPRRCATKGVPAIYTDVKSYLRWILDNLK